MSEIAETVNVNAPRPMSDRFSLPALVAASGISELGNGLTILAVPWFVLVTTGSAALTGLSGAAAAVATVVAGIFGGTLVDRLGFKRASILSDLASGVTVALIPTLYLLHLLEFWMILVLVFLGTLLDGPGNAARRAMIPGVVRRAGSTLERANAAMQFATLSTGDFLAPLAAGVLIGLIGAASVLYIDAATFAASMLIVAVAVPVARRAEESGVEAASAGRSSYFAELKEGVRYVFTDSFLSVVIPISIAVNFLISPLFVVALPVLANDVFGSPRALGIMAAGVGAGAGVGTILYGAFGHKVKRYTVYWAAIAGISVGLWLLAFSSVLWMAVVATVIMGLAAGPVNAVGMVIIQIRVPERMMGRVLGLLYAGSGLATPLGLVVGGVVVQWYGVTAAMVASSVGVTLCVFWILFSRSLRAVAAEMEEGR
ncbi:MAG TPA: MFS transporter [Thermomicrobiales bacterium]|nr:MFS transporter [Thermomicrobiales bacterium]